MLDDFFIRALIAGMGVALITGPMGCFTIWKRLSFFGDTLAHSALLGATFAISFQLPIALSIFLISSALALFLISLQKKTKLPKDALLGLLSHSTLAIGLVVIGFLSSIRFDLMGLLFGDILAVSKFDLFIIWLGAAFILLVLYWIWRPLFATTVNYELASAEGMKPERMNIIFTLLMAAMIAIAIKIVGLLLITGMLIIPAATARNLSDNPKKMIIVSTVVGIISVCMGLLSSLKINSASGPSIITTAMILFLISLIYSINKNKLKRLKL
jgi:zinc transport system permease protein